MIYQNIYNYLRNSGIKQTIVSQKSGMTKQALSDSLRGKRRIGAEEYLRICDALGVPLDYFRDDKFTSRKAS